MPNTERSHPTRGYTLGHVLGKHWPWVLGSVVVLGMMIYAYQAHNAVEDRQVAAAERELAVARAASEEGARAVAAAAAASAEAAMTPEQRAKEARAAAEAQHAEAMAREARAKLVAKMDAMKWSDQCRAWGREAKLKTNSPWREVLIEHLTREEMVNGQDLMSVTERIPAVGMTTCGVYAQMGTPSAVNITTTAHSTTVQMVYRDPGIYVYTRARPGDGNGVVDSVQR